MPTAVVTERPFETASGSSKKASEIENIKRLNSITSKPRARSRLSTSSRIKETVNNQKENMKQQSVSRAEAASARQRLQFKRSSTSSTKAISRRATDSDLGGIKSLRSETSQSLQPPATPVNSSKPGEFSGSEKKKIILGTILDHQRPTVSKTKTTIDKWVTNQSVFRCYKKRAVQDQIRPKRRCVRSCCAKTSRNDARSPSWSQSRSESDHPHNGKYCEKQRVARHWNSSHVSSC